MRTTWAIVAAMGVAPSALGGVIRHDVPDSEYTGLAARPEFDSVGVLLNFAAGSLCSATLIGREWVLTAAHCVDGVTPAGAVTFSVGGVTRTASEVHVHPGWTANLALGFDIALVRLSEPIDSVDPAPLYWQRGEFGKIGTAVGYGLGGDGLTGFGGSSGTKRAGQNVLDFGGADLGPPWSPEIVMWDFDNPDDPSDNFSNSAEPLGLEYQLAPGDSGGSTWVLGPDGRMYVMGVHSFIASIDGITDSDYGDISGVTRVSGYQDWVRSLVPAPGSAAVVGLGVLAGCGRRRR